MNTFQLSILLWDKTGNMIIRKNRMLWLAFKLMAVYQTKLEEIPKDRHLVPIRGHTRVHKLFPFYPADLATMETHRTRTVSQIFEPHLTRGIEKSISPSLLTLLLPYPVLQHKLRVFKWVFLQKLFHNRYASPRSLANLVNLETNLSRRYHRKCQKILDTSIGVAPAYHTRIWDGIAIRPSQRALNNAYNLLRLPSLTSKTRETAFQILNQTIWTNNKSFKSCLRPDPNCEKMQLCRDHGAPTMWMWALLRGAMEQNFGKFW